MKIIKAIGFFMYSIAMILPILICYMFYESDYFRMFVWLTVLYYITTPERVGLTNMFTGEKL